jgi:hypothetical protein
MTIMQLINLFLMALFLGSLNAYIAKRQGRPQLPWFFASFTLGVLGLVLYFIYPSLFSYFEARRPREVPPPLSPQHQSRTEAWLKHWYYIDDHREQKGPIEFPDLIQNWKNKQLNDASFVWGEGMKEWKTLSELPEVKKEFEIQTLLKTAAKKK